MGTAVACLGMDLVLNKGRYTKKIFKKGAIASNSNKFEDLKYLTEKNLQDIQHNFETVFNKKLTSTENKELISKYKAIYDITDDKEFIEKLFNQIKEDYGFKNSKIECIIKSYTKQNRPAWLAMHTDLGHQILLAKTEGVAINRKDLFKILCHEFKYHKQFEISIATNKEAFIDALASKKIKNILQNKLHNVVVKRVFLIG